MIIIKKGQLNELVVTVSQNKTLNNPYYLFSFQHVLSKERISFIPLTLSSNCRYDKFSFIESGTTSSLVPVNGTPPIINFPYLGQYYYSVFEQISSGNTNINYTYAKLESGRCNVVIGENSNDNCFFEEYISLNEDNNNLVFVSYDEEACVNEVSPLPTTTPTPTVTVTSSLTPSLTPTNTLTPSITPSITESLTPTNTPSNTESPGASATSTPTLTVTPTITPSISESQTPTPTITSTLTPSISETQTSTPTITSTVTPSITPSISETQTQTPTITATITPSISQSQTPTPTITSTLTPSITPTSTEVNDDTALLWGVVNQYIAANTDEYLEFIPHTPRPSPTQTNTPSLTPSITPTISVSKSPDPTTTPTLTPSISETQTPTPSITATVTSSITPTPSITQTNTPTNTLTKTPVNSPTTTPTNTQTNTPTFTATPTITRTPNPTPFIPGFNPGSAFVNAVLVDSENKILVGGDFTGYRNEAYPYLIRLNDDLTIDHNFTHGNKLGDFVLDLENPNGSVTAVLEDGDYYLIAGNFTSYNGQPANRIIKIDKDGTLIWGGGYNGSARGIKKLADGNYMLWGDVAPPVKLSVNGTVVSTWKGNINYTAYFGEDTTLNKYVFGSSQLTSYSGISVGNIIRTDVNGYLDTTFSAGTFSAATGIVCPDIIVNTDNYLIGGGWKGYSGITSYMITSVNKDGTFNSNFNIPLLALPGIADTNTIISRDNFIYFGGFYPINVVSGSTSSGYNQINLSGTPISSFNFGRNGFVGTNIIRDSFFGSDYIIIVGANQDGTYNGTIYNGIVRIDLSGNTYVPPIPTSTPTNTQSPTITPSISVSKTPDPTPTNTPTNSLTPTNTPLPLECLNLGNPFRPEYLYQDSVGNTLVVGQFSAYSGDGTYQRVVLIDSKGNVVSGWKGSTLTGGSTYLFNSIIFGNNYIIGGSFTGYTSNGITTTGLTDAVVLNSDASVNTSFVLSGVSSLDKAVKKSETQLFVNNGGSINLIDLSGNTVPGFTSITGNYDSALEYDSTNNWLYATLRNVNYRRYNGTTGVYDTTFSGQNAQNTFVIKKDTISNKTYIGGSFTSYGATSRPYIARINYDGTLDTSFTPTFNSYINDIEIESDGRVVVVGNFSTVNGVSRNGIVRLNTDGTTDTSFVIGTGFNADVKNVRIEPPGTYLVGGYFTSYSGISASGLFRLKNDGTEFICNPTLVETPEPGLSPTPTPTMTDGASPTPTPSYTESPTPTPSVTEQMINNSLVWGGDNQPVLADENTYLEINLPEPSPTTSPTPTPTNPKL